MEYNSDIILDEDSTLDITTTGTGTFPDDDGKKPINLFHETFVNVLRNEINLKANYRLQLQTKISWYVGELDIIENELKKLDKFCNTYLHFIERTVSTDNEKDYRKYNNIAFDKQLELRSKIESFSKKLAKLSINEVNV